MRCPESAIRQVDYSMLAWDTIWDTGLPTESVIVGPLGDLLVGPLKGSAGLLTAEIDTDELTRARYDFDVVGHYSRPDRFELTVDERARAGVVFIKR